MKKKVAILSIQYPPTIGGLQAHVKGIVNLLKKKEYDLKIFTSTPNPTMKIDGKREKNVINLPVIFWFKDSPIINPFNLYAELKKYNPDIVHLVYPFPLALDIACFYAIKEKKKLICTYIDDIILDNPYALFIKLYEKSIWRFWLKKIKAISASSIDYAKASSGLNKWKKKVFVIPPPVFKTNFNLDLEMKKKAKIKLNLDNYDKVVLFVGGLRERLFYKRPDIVLKAWAEYHDKIKSNSILIIIGDGELKEKYRKTTKKLGIEKKVIFRGYVSRESLIDHYLAGDILILPSQDNNEAFGITPVEAMLYGNAIIASDIPGIRGALKRVQANVSLIPPLNVNKVIDEIIFWISKNLEDYSIENHEYVKNFFKDEIISEEIKRFYEE